MDIHFGCTQCGVCCHNLKLPLTVDEAIGWAGRGNAVQVLCEASAAFDVPDVEAPARYRYDRSFAATSGTVPIRVSVTFAASFAGACPHLRADMRCGIYEERPRVCRIYPAEISPNLEVIPSRKACPPEAWAADQPVLLHEGVVTDTVIRSDIELFRVVLADMPLRARACRQLGIKEAAFSNEGFAVSSPAPQRLIDVLRQSQLEDVTPVSTEWTIVTNRATTMDTLETVDARGAMISDGPGYIGFFPDEPRQGTR